MVSDSVSGSPALLLMVSLPVLLTLSLICLPASGRVFHRVSCGPFGCVLAVFLARYLVRLPVSLALSDRAQHSLSSLCVGSFPGALSLVLGSVSG